MEVRTHFNLSDRAWHIFSQGKNELIACPSCDHGKVSLRDGRLLDCPQCKSTGLVNGRHRSYWVVSKPMTVGQIRFEIDLFKSEESYMCRETGVGSGSIYYLRDLFKSEELAQVECDRRNNEDAHCFVCTICRPEFESFKYQVSRRDWRCCPIHGSTQHVDEKEAQAAVAAHARQQEHANYADAD